MREGHSTKSSAGARIESRRALPRVDHLLEAAELAEERQEFSSSSLRDAVRAALDAARAILGQRALEDGELFELIRGALHAPECDRLRPVINATGVLLHTNLGRAPLPATAIDELAAIATGACDLELALERGKRGGRGAGVAALIAALTGAEDALVVNNNAAAVLLALAALASEGEALVSRGELVEIGGSFRMPDVMDLSGARLVEVGTTNRTRAADFAAALSPSAAVILRVHRGNFRQEGFVESPELSELSTLAVDSGVHLLVDLGHGALLPLDLPGGDGLPSTVSGCLEAGADLVLFSGDKLLGGPQAGIAAGRAELVERMRRHPLHRALRAGKMTQALLEAVLSLYRRDPEKTIPILRRIFEPIEELRARAQALADRISPKLAAGSFTVELVPSEAEVGGGSDAAYKLPSMALTLASSQYSLDELAQRLRAGRPSVVARIAAEKLWFDLRSVPPTEEGRLAAALEGLVQR